MWLVCKGGQLGRIPSVPGYLVFRTLGMWCVCMGGQLGILSIPVRGVYVWADN